MKTKSILTALLTMLFAFSNANAANFNYEEDLYLGGQYEGKAINVATSDILQSIGASSISDVTMYAIKTDGTRTADYRHDGIGADGWRTADGTFTNWNVNSVFYVQPDHNTGTFVIGQFPGAITAPTRLTADFVYVNNSTSAEATVTIALNIIDPSSASYVVVNTIDLPIYITPAVAYEGGNEVKFDLPDAISTLGAASANDIAAFIYQPDETFVPNTTDGWRNAEGFAAGWNTSASMVCCKADIAASRFFDIMAIDASYAEGSTYTAKWALTANGKAIIYNINITFGEDPNAEKPTFDIVKTINIDHTEQANIAYDTEGAAPTFSVEEVCTALGISDISAADVYVVNVTDGEFVKNTTDGWRDANGDLAPWASATNGFCLKLGFPHTGAFDYSGAHDTNFNDGDTYVAKFALTAGGKAVVLQVNITFKTLMSATMEITSAQYSTFCAPFEVTIPAGVTASVAILKNDGTTLELLPVYPTIPAGAPVILFAEEGLAATTFTGFLSDICPVLGALTGVYTDTVAPEGSYVLQNQNGNVAFYKVATEIIVPANKAYLTAPSSGAKAINFPSATAINTIEALTSGSAKIYDMNGREINKLQKGINIVNGVKVMVK